MTNVFLEGLQRPAILQNNSGLPDYSEAQDGDALIIEDGEPTWGAVDALPEIEASDEGKVLAVDQGEAVWADAPSGLPEITNSDEGKVLTVVEDFEHGTTSVIVAQQNATIVDAPVDISNYDFSGITDATTGVIMTVNGDSYDCEILEDNGTLTVIAITDPPFYRISSDGKFYAYAPKSGGGFGFDPVPGTYALSLSHNIPTLAPVWAEPSGGVSVVRFATSKAGASCDKTYAELGNIFQLDMPIIGALEIEGEYSLRTPLMEAGASNYSFIFFTYHATGLQVERYTVANDDTCTYSAAVIPATWS